MDAVVKVLHRDLWIDDPGVKEMEKCMNFASALVQVQFFQRNENELAGQ